MDADPVILPKYAARVDAIFVAAERAIGLRDEKMEGMPFLHEGERFLRLRAIEEPHFFSRSTAVGQVTDQLEAMIAGVVADSVFLHHQGVQLFLGTAAADPDC